MFGGEPKQKQMRSIVMIYIHGKIYSIFKLCSMKLFPTKSLYIHP